MGHSHSHSLILELPFQPSFTSAMLLKYCILAVVAVLTGRINGTLSYNLVTFETGLIKLI